MKHKLLFRRFFASLLLLAVSTISWAYDFEVNGIYYDKNSDGTSVTVTYKDENYNSYSGAVVIPSSVEYYEHNYTVTSIGDWTFSGCSGLSSITIPNSVTSIGREAFSNCSGLTSVTIPNSVTSIGDYTFWYCSGLTSVTIPNSVTSIGSEAFRNCGLTSITIPNSVTSIGAAAFGGCSGLTSIYVDSNNMAYDSRNNCNAIIETSSNTLISGCKNTVIPNSVTSIGAAAFWGCSGLTSITIPNSVTSIGNQAFDLCSGLTSITVASGNTKYDSRNNCNAIIETSSNTLVSGCKNTIIPNTVTSIGFAAFGGCSGLTSVTIPNSVTSIGSEAFRNCGLTSITIPNSVTSIGAAAFEYCSGLTSVHFYNSNPVSIASYTFSNRANATLYVPKGAKAAYEAADYWKEFKEIIEFSPTIKFADANVKAICVANWDTSGDGELDEDEAAAVTSLGEVFKDNTTITSFDELQYFTGLATIGDHAFEYCSGLTSITIPNSVTSIGSRAFGDCSGLTSITIPESVTSFGGTAFWGCSGLTSITIPNNVTSIGESTFWSCSGLASIEIPNSVTSVGKYAFYKCSGLTSVTIGFGVTSIGNNAFGDCKFRTIVSRAVNPAKYSLGSVGFTDATYLHTPLYVPENSFWDYVYGTEWYRFNIIKEYAATEVEARQAYMLADTDGTNFTVYNAASDKLVTKEYMHQVDETSLGSNWVAEPCGAGVALLNLGAEKYAQISNDGKISLSDTPQELDIEFSDGVATANGRQMMLVLNDDDDITEVVTLRYTPSASEDSFDPNAPIYDLMGRRLQQKPASGYYIQGGKKYFVK